MKKQVFVNKVVGMLFFGISFVLSVQGGVVNWFIQTVCTNRDTVTASAEGLSGSYYYCGTYMGPAKVGEFELDIKGRQNAYIAKIDAHGLVKWVLPVLSEFSKCESVVRGSSNIIYVIGNVSSNAIFGTYELGNSTSTGFLLSVDDDGKIHWCAQLPGEVISLATNGSNLIVAGNFVGQVKLGANVYESVSESYDFYIAKFDNDGKLLWCRIFGGENDELINKIAVSTSGEIFGCGSHIGTAEIGGHRLEAEDFDEQFFVLKLDIEGNCDWAASGGSPETDSLVDIITDLHDGCIACGFVGGAGSFLGSDFNTSGAQDVIIIRVLGNGKLSWIKTAGGRGTDSATSIKQFDDRIFICGLFEKAAQFGGFNISTDYRNASFLAEYDLNGDCRRAWPFGGLATCMAVQSARNILIGGIIPSGEEFQVNGQKIISTGSSDGFVCLVDPLYILLPKLSIFREAQKVKLCATDVYRLNLVVECTDSLLKTNNWSILTNFVSDTSSAVLEIEDLFNSQVNQRFYRFRAE